MSSRILAIILITTSISFSSCVSKKKYAELQTKYDTDVENLEKELNRSKGDLTTCEAQNQILQNNLVNCGNQLEDCKAQRDKQLDQVGDLTALSKSANDNIKETLSQLEKKDKYISLLQAAKSKADSMNLALAVNLKSVLKDGIEDNDVDIKVDKTVVMINLSDKMMFESGSYKVTPRANEVLGKIANIVKSRPGFDVMIEGYTDNVPINKYCIKDNWELSVLRASAVVKALQENHSIDPNRLIAAGRGEYNTLASNDTPEGKAANRRTRVIIMPKLDQFYDLLDPSKVPDIGK